ncbi:MAG: triose-phosphate isomerase [Thalassotalea sp.]
MTRKAIVLANWKMHGNLTLLQNMSERLNRIITPSNLDVIICPSFPYLMSAKQMLMHDNIVLGAQNMSEFKAGAYTGEVSADMLKELAVKYVVLGHSERRSLYHETNSLVALKVETALNAQLTPIFCIGEREEDRTSGQTEAFLSAQIQAVIDKIGIEKFNDVVIAYEPLWAIGTGKTASPELAQETHRFIRAFLAELDTDIARKIPIIYGGSVNANNCEKLFQQPDIDGGLIGGASLNVDEFERICLTIKG